MEKEIVITMTIKLDSWKKSEIKAEILEFLKQLDLINLEMREE